MKLRLSFAFLFAGAAITISSGAARADQIFCAPTVSSVGTATPRATADTTYNVLITTYGTREATSAEIVAWDGNREYPVTVPLAAKKAVSKGPDTLRFFQFRPLSLRFRKPVSLEAMWIAEIGDHRRHIVSCYPNATLSSVNSGSKLETAALKKAIIVAVPEQHGVPFSASPNCGAKYVDATAVSPTTPEYPEAAKEAGLGEVTVVIRVNVKPDGGVAEALVQESSGNPAIDQAALTAAMQSKYAPKKVGCVTFAGIYLFRATFDPNS